MSFSNLKHQILSLLEIRALVANDPRQALQRGLVNEYILQRFKEAGKADSFPEGIDFDKKFLAIARKVARKSYIPIPEEDFENQFIDALLAAITEPAVKAFDKKFKGDFGERPFMRYFGEIMRRKMLDQVYKFQTRKKYEDTVHDTPEEEDMSQEEQLELRRTQDPRAPDHSDEISYKEFLKEFDEHLSDYPGGDKWLRQIFQLQLQGYRQNEIAGQLEISRAAVNKFVKRIRGALIDFARAENDDMLLGLIKRYTSEDHTAGSDPASDLNKVLEMFKRKRSNEKRQPAGEVSQIKRTTKTPPETATEAVVLNDQTLQADLDRSMRALDHWLASQDDVLERPDGKLTGLTKVR